jgi:transcriptional regulator with XRE-family HTH domain
MDMNDIDNIGKRVLSIRKQKNLKQKNFCKLIGVTQSYLSVVEHDKQMPSLVFIMSVLKATKVNGDWLLTGRGSMYPQIKEKKEEIKGINEERAAYGVSKSYKLDDVLDTIKKHWDTLNDGQKRILVEMVKEMVKNNEILLEENRRLKDFLIKIATNQPGEIPSNVVQRLTN